MGRGAQVDVDQRVDVGLGHRRERAGPADPGVGHHQVQPAQLVAGGIDGPPRAARFAQVAGDAHGAGVGRHAVQRGQVAAGDGQPHAVRGERPGRGGADAARPAGDQRAHPVQAGRPGHGQALRRCGAWIYSSFRSGARHRRRGRREQVLDLALVLAVLPVGVVDLVELPDHPDEVGLPVQQLPGHDAGGLGQRRHAQVLAGQHRLGLDQLLVEPVQRQPGRQHRVLHVEQAVVEGGQPAGFGEPGLGARVGRLHGDVDDLRHAHRPVPDEREPRLVPVRVGDDVDGHAQPHGPGHFQRLVVDLRRGPLAERLQPVLVQRLQAEEHVVQPEPPPAPEHLLVAEQHVAAGFQVVLLADAAALQLAGDLVALLGLDERHVVHDEHARLGDPGHVLGGRFRRQPAVAAAVERPRAAERAVPRAAAGELDRRGRVHHPDEVLAAAAAQVPGGQVVVQAVQHGRRPARPVQRDDPGHLSRARGRAARPAARARRPRLRP